MDRKIAVVTGGARGIGFSEASKFAEEGYGVFVADIDAQAAELAAQKLGDVAFPITLDVRSEESVLRMFATIENRFGKLDVLVNNAGITSFEPTVELSEERWTQVTDIHLGGTFRCAKAAFPLLVKCGGSIVNTASISATFVSGAHVAYAAAKGGIMALTRDLAVEWAPRNVRVNAVAPGRINTPMLAELVKSGVRDGKTYTARIPLGRLGEPEDIAVTVFFLAHDAKFITGQTIVVDGGFTIWNTGA